VITTEKTPDLLNGEAAQKRKFAVDSLLEGTGFEPPGPAEGARRRHRVDFADFPLAGESSRHDMTPSENLVVSRGTGGSNPAPSSGESRANLIPSITAPKSAKRDDATRLHASGTLSHCVSDIAVPHDLESTDPGSK
jgi:hypothetical protein